MRVIRGTYYKENTTSYIDQSNFLNNISILYEYIYQTNYIINITFESNKERMEIIWSIKDCQLQRNEDILNLDI